jgi:hypothetical protein
MADNGEAAAQQSPRTQPRRLILGRLAKREPYLKCRGIVDVFLRDKFLYWLEALSLCKGVLNGVASVAKLLLLFQACSPHNTITTNLC